VCRDGSVCRIRRRVSPAINLDDEKRRSVSPMSSPCVGRRVSPPINLLKEKEWDP